MRVISIKDLVKNFERYVHYSINLRRKIKKIAINSQKCHIYKNFLSITYYFQNYTINNFILVLESYS